MQTCTNIARGRAGAQWGAAPAPGVLLPKRGKNHDLTRAPPSVLRTPLRETLILCQSAPSLQEENLQIYIQSKLFLQIISMPEGKSARIQWEEKFPFYKSWQEGDELRNLLEESEASDCRLMVFRAVCKVQTRK